MNYIEFEKKYKESLDIAVRKNAKGLNRLMKQFDPAWSSERSYLDVEFDNLVKEYNTLSAAQYWTNATAFDSVVPSADGTEEGKIK